MKIGEKGKLELYGESDGYIIVHNHFEVCPVCKKKDAKTDAYFDIVEEFVFDNEEIIITCENCGSKFKLIDPRDSLMDEGLWERIE